MGYVENCLPKALAALGHEVHLVTSTAQVYFNSPAYAVTYEPFLGPGVVPGGVKALDGYTLHRLPYGWWRKRLRIKGLARILWRLKPQIVQALEVVSQTTYEAALAKAVLGYKLFLETHIHASVFPPAGRSSSLRQRARWRWHAATLGRWVNAMSEKCYPISSDAAELAVRFFGIDKGKIEISSLGVDTELFSPVWHEDAARRRVQMRQLLRLSPSDVACVYTGRFARAKDPQCLAEAVGSLARDGLPFRGIFVGNGRPEEVAAIVAHPGCSVHPFVPFRELPPYYWAADIAVWPRQESSSQLDAVACGLPIIVSDHVAARERVEGNGFVYREGDAADLARQLRALCDPALRRTLGEHGADKIRRLYSWHGIARRRVDAYARVLRAAEE
jgi:glycosyltransferase involved in cell wall biosynthesis